ncbi:1-acyl-sn-glycerol-3-phosphate acyltransferase [Nocardioides daedukensis]|uniref:1-acyl-sn-glycerol-3-phosphate acyltransferase n=1 Tax=Nocardioides daedukensis TaxID=634462 RepID=A0A7Y9RZH1_9ACTN|nr:1-acyl-sn-glycerol-3-phosphate acyltransferase [Nocardioides daedukensis]
MAILKPTLNAATRRTWIDGEHIPAEGGCVVALNHVSHVDPLLAALFTYDHGRIPRYLAKAGLFRNKFLGGFLKSAGQIPVERLSANAVGAFDAAVQGVRDGKCVIVYVEGTITRDPDLWPMVGKSGAARIALETGCPVIPVAHWGVQEILAPYGRKPRLLPRKHVVFKAGPPVRLDDLADADRSVETFSRATARIVDDITGLLEDIRGEKAPPVRFDPRKSGVKLIGNPHKDTKKGRRR